MGALEDIQQRRAWGALVSKTAPKTWVEAASRLLDHMEEHERKKLDSVTALQSHEIRRKIRALRKLGDVVDAGVKAPGSKSTPTVPDNDDARAIALAQVLCPPNWRKNILPIFEKARIEAEDNFIQSDLEEDFEYRAAIDLFIKTLYETELTGSVARSKQLQVVMNG